MKTNDEIRAPKVRLIGSDGGQVGIVSLSEAKQMARQSRLDLVEVVPNATPPVCKIIDYGKFRYDQTKREKENKKAQHQIKVKEVKLKPNIGEHDFQNKLKRAREFVEKGCKVKVTCMFRGREMAHKEVGLAVVQRMVDGLEDLASPESQLKLMGRFLTVVMAPSGKGKKK